MSTESMNADARTGAEVGKAKEALSSAAGQAGEKVASGIDSQKNKAAEGLGGFANALRQTGDQMRSQQQGESVSEYIASAANQIERLSGYLRSTNAKEMLRNVEDFARRQPAVFIGGAFVIGLLSARFLKSSGTSSPAKSSFSQAD